MAEQQMQQKQRFQFEVGRSYTLRGVRMIPGIGLNVGDKTGQYLGTYISWCERIIHEWGSMLSKDSYEKHHIWDGRIDRIEDDVIHSKPDAIFGNRIVLPGGEITDREMETRKRQLEILRGAA